MGKAAEKFQIELPDNTVLERDDLVEHIEYGPMVVDSIRVAPGHKTAVLKSELGPEGLDISADKLREEWGDTIHTDPEVLRDGRSRVESTGITIDNLDIEVSLTTDGEPQKAVEIVHMYANEQIVRALQAIQDHTLPEECDGVGLEIDWDHVFTQLEEEGEGE